jgi:hypothetical protein
MGVENLNVFQDNTGDQGQEALEPQHSVGEGQAVDPAEQFTAPEEVPEPHDDVDVALQEGKDTQDGKGDDEVPPADFVSYEDPSADTQEEQN